MGFVFISFSVKWYSPVNSEAWKYKGVRFLSSLFPLGSLSLVSFLQGNGATAAVRWSDSLWVRNFQVVFPFLQSVGWRERFAIHDLQTAEHYKLTYVK